MIRPVDTLLLLKDQIGQETFHPCDLRSIEFKKNDGEKNISDNVVNILCSFKNHSLLPEAIELLLLYYKNVQTYLNKYTAHLYPILMQTKVL